MEKIGCLIIHGFGGGRFEIEPLRSFLNNQGYETYCPLLAGHERGRRELAHTGYHNWIDSAQEGYDILKSKCSKVIIIGFSMGGLIGVNLLKNNEAAGLVTLSTPVWFWDFKIIAGNIFNDIRKGRKASIKRYVRSVVRIPLTACLNFHRLLRKTKPMFKEVNVPCLIVQGKRDDTARWQSADYIHGHIKSEKKELKYFDDAPHLICCYESSQKVFNHVLRFAQSLED